MSIERITFSHIPSSIKLSSTQIGPSGLATNASIFGTRPNGPNADNEIEIIQVNDAAIDLSGWTFSSWTSGEDVIRIVGSSSANSIVGSRAGDTLTGGSGADSLDGRDDIDTAVYTGNLAEYRITGTPAALTMTDLRSTGVSDGADTVSNIELFQFADGTFTLAQILDQFDVTTPVDAATGVVTVAGAIDRDAAGPSATIEVTATSSDGSTAASTFSIAIGAMSTSSMCRSLWTRTPAPIRWPRTR